MTMTCQMCARSYICSPLDDHYNSTTNNDGLCFSCLLAQAEAPESVPVVTVLDPPLSDDSATDDAPAR